VSSGVIPPSPTPSQATAGFTAGARIAGYRLEEEIGRGGMAVVFRALDERLNRLVALKIMTPTRSLDDAFRLRFIRESQAAAAVDDPHIIPVYEAGEADGVLFIAMRLVRGGDLKTLVARHGPLEPARVEWILSGVASALDAAHTSGLVHRDVKPANMLLDVRQGRLDHVYLSDFGVTKGALETAGLTGSGQFLGTVDYAAPEQVKGRQVDGQADQYALGCSAYELLCGRPPFSGRELVAAMYAHVSEPPPKVSTVCEGLPAAVDAVFARVLAKDPDQRYDSCLDFARALRSALGLPAYADDQSARGVADGGAAGAVGDDDTLAPADARRQVNLAREAARVGQAVAGTTTELPIMEGAGGQATARTDGLAGDRGPWRRLLVAVLAVAVLAAGAAVGLMLGRGNAQATTVSTEIQQAYTGGLAVTQFWMLTGSRGSELDVTVTAQNTTAKSVLAQLDEPIPAVVALYPHTIRFGPGNSPRTELAGTGVTVLIWDLSLPARGSKQVSFQVPELPYGATQARLQTLISAYNQVVDLQTLQPERGGQPFVARMVIMPARVQLAVGQTDTLTLLVPMSKGTAALRRELSGAAWHSNHPAAVTVSSDGVVTGMAPGNARITARVGSVTAVAIVTVVPLGTSPSPGQQPPVYTTPPAGGQTPPVISQSTSTSTSTSSSVSPSTSGSTTGSASVSPSQTPDTSPSSGSASPSNSATG
jgi:hypothetical protein